MQIIKKMLPCELTDAEVLDIATEMSQKLEELDNVEAEKKAAAANFKLLTDALESEISIMAKSVRTKTEEREVDCEWVFNLPVPGMKQLIRLDTEEVVDEKDMTDMDKQMAADMKQYKMFAQK